MENQTVKEGKTNAIISHFWILGTIIAIILNNNKKNSFSSFYIRQMIGLNLLSILNLWIVERYIGSFTSWIIDGVLFILWVISFVSMLKEEEKETPIVGEHFQEWFKNF